jgi:hypothetical protein
MPNVLKWLGIDGPFLSVHVTVFYGKILNDYAQMFGMWTLCDAYLNKFGTSKVKSHMLLLRTFFIKIDWIILCSSLSKILQSLKFNEIYEIHMSNLNKRMNKLCVGSSFHFTGQVKFVFSFNDIMNYVHIVTTPIVMSFKHNISTVCEVKTCLFYIYKETV